VQDLNVEDMAYYIVRCGCAGHECRGRLILYFKGMVVQNLNVGYMMSCFVSWQLFRTRTGSTGGSIGV
jgi:hypothetical protein